MWMDRNGEKEVYTYAKRYYPVHARGALVRAAMKFSTSSSTPPSTTARVTPATLFSPSGWIWITPRSRPSCSLLFIVQDRELILFNFWKYWIL